MELFTEIHLCIRAGASKGTPDDARCVTEIFGRTKIRKLEGDKCIDVYA